eukprot:m.107245 g.107245  ORF g.107245 m.107245 type:complete len:511 (-) comp15310_c1_seq1:756-2288(-)
MMAKAASDGLYDSVFLLDSDDDLEEETVVDNQAYAKFTLIEGDEAQSDQFVTVKAKAKAKNVRIAVYICGLIVVAIVVGVSIGSAHTKRHHGSSSTASSEGLSVSTSLLFTTQPQPGVTGQSTSQPASSDASTRTSTTLHSSSTISLSVTTTSQEMDSSSSAATSSPTQTSAEQSTTVNFDAIEVCDTLKPSSPNNARPQPVYKPCAQHAMLSQADLCRTTPVSDSALDVILVGDFGRDGLCCQVDVAVEMALASTKLNADFIVSTGDNFYPNGLQFVGDLQSKTSFSNVYTSLQPLQKDWYAVLGNHDVRGSVEAQLSLNVNDSFWNMPSRYYTKTFETNSVSVQFIFIDTNLMLVGLESNNTHQLAWLNETLDKSTADWIIMVGHHPVITAGTHKKELIKQKNADRPSSYVADYLLPLFDKYNVAAYFCGHDHDLQHLQVANISTQLFVTGAGSMIRDPLEYANETAELVQGFGLQGYMTASLNATHMQVQMLDYVGVLHYTYLIPRL